MKRHIIPAGFFTSLAAAALVAAETPTQSATPTVPPTPAPPVSKIVPGKVIVPTDAMRRPWGELISLDSKTRTGKFRNENTNEVVSFTLLPYAELYHHGAFGDLQDFRVGVRAMFRLHQNDAGEWVLATYIQDQMRMMFGHQEYFYVDSIDAEHGKVFCTQAKFDQTLIREHNIPIETDGETLFWKKGQPAKFSDIHVGDAIRTETHGLGKGKTQMCWQVFLDDESFQKVLNAQKALNAKRLAEEGLPGYVDKLEGKDLDLTLFQEGNDVSRSLKPGDKIRVAPAGVDRKPTAPAVAGVIASAKMVSGPVYKVSVTLDNASDAFPVGIVARLWVDK
jgi:hypothetical protein